MAPVDRRKAGSMERHVQTILLSVCTAGILGIAKVGWDMSHELTGLRVEKQRMAEAQRDMAQALKLTQDRFDAYMPRVEIESRFEAVRASHNDHGRRLDALERRRP